MIKKLIIAFGLFVMLGSFGINLAVSVPAYATVDPNCKHAILGIDPWYKYLEVGDDGNGDKCAIKPFPGDDEFDWGKAFPRVGMGIVDILLRVAAIIAVGFTVYGGFRYILSQGEPDATKKAKGTIINASVGLVITMFASIIVGFVGGLLWK